MRAFTILLATLVVLGCLVAGVNLAFPNRPAASVLVRPFDQVFARGDTIFVVTGGELRFLKPSWTRCAAARAKR